MSTSNIEKVKLVFLCSHWSHTHTLEKSINCCLIVCCLSEATQNPRNIVIMNFVKKSKVFSCTKVRKDMFFIALAVGIMILIAILLSNSCLWFARVLFAVGWLLTWKGKESPSSWQVPQMVRELLWLVWPFPLLLQSCLSPETPGLFLDL